MIRNFLHMLTYCRPYWRFYLVGTVCLVFVDLIDTFTPKLVQWAINHLELWRYETGRMSAEATAAMTPERLERLGNPLREVMGQGWMASDSYLSGIWVYAVLLVAVVAITGLFRYGMSMSYARASINLTHDLRGRFFAHVQRLSARHHDKAKTGAIMSLSTSDMDACRFFYGFGLLLLIDTGLYFIMVPAYMATISWKLMAAAMLTLPLIPIIVAKLAHAIENRYEHLQAQFAVLSERSRESYAGAKVIQSFTQEQSEAKTFAKLSRDYFRRGMRLAWVLTLENPLLVLLIGLADLVVVVYGGALVIRGEITTGEFVAFFQYLIRLSGPMIGLGWVVMLYQRGRVSMARIERVLDVPQEITVENPADVETLKGGIELRNLTFTYVEAVEAEIALGGKEEKAKGNGKPDKEPKQDAAPALVDISLTVEPGRTLAIVGPVGSGKSTLLNLVPRLYDPPPGTVFLDGHDVRTIPIEVLRTQIGSVQQETFLFSETILQNIELGTLGADGKADPEWLKKCARIAQIEPDVLEFPKQFETLLGEKGVNLSGGQKQRVAIARAIARKPAILMLDDCLSAVDTQTEEAILRGLKEVMKEQTTLIVSHRISTVEHADEIIVLDRGRVIERGRHEELLELGGHYAELYAKQQLEQELEV